MKYLVVVDMQNDFISGALGSAIAQAIVAKAKEIAESFDGEIIFTRDTHFDNYMDTREGRRLPVPHCIKDTWGWEICDELKPISKSKKILDKPTFGSVELIDYLREKGDVESVCLLGLCTDICVISNAMLIKVAFPEADVAVYEKASAGVSRESHNTALQAMSACQIDVL
ncbi:MAG: isochorismatase family cysteine hydrolase [Clostridia bacterium]|nr:isochorismatase family cysteine hydrolase [Clostridia bacterium]